MPPGYPYNMDPNYGPVPMVTDDGKIAVAQPMIKEERLKESPSPNENPKNQSQVRRKSAGVERTRVFMRPLLLAGESKN